MNIRQKYELPSSERRDPLTYLSDLLARNSVVINPPVLKAMNKMPIPGPLYLAHVRVDKRNGQHPPFIDSFRNDPYFKIQIMPKIKCP